MKQISTVIITVGCTIGFFFVTLGCDDPDKREYGIPGNKCSEDGDECKAGYTCENGICVAEDDVDGGADDSGPGGSGGSGGRGGSGESGGSEAGTGGSECDEPEVCDGKDNDCDGETDEDTRDQGGECDTGKLGLCREGVERCEDGSLVCVQEIEPTDEVCDGADNDCDGETDEEYPAEDEDCDTGEPGDCGPGTQKCRDGVMVCVSLVETSDEICDGEDNDCDGETDETCCDPRDPEDICDEDEHCIPQDDDSVPRCTGEAGTKEQNQYCEDIDDCVATADCQVYSADDSTSKICMEQCRVGEDDCDGDNESCEEFDPPRMIGDQEWGVCKSMPPDAPSDWNCDAFYYGTDDGCDCGCGVFDPDCEDATPAACDGCPPDSCGYNICNPENTFVATDNAICEERPDGWICPPLTYGDGAICDCGCGIVDSDCDSADREFCEQCPTNSCAFLLCDVLTFEPTDSSQCLPQPVGWTCPPDYWDDGSCDCGCGFVDIDCDEGQTHACDYCGTGSCDPFDFDDPYDIMCELINTSHNAVCGATAPDEWTCVESFYLDDECDCGCGVIDPDCLGNTPADCDVIFCVELDPSDISQCIS